MRTTVRLDDGLLKEAKKRAAESNETLTSVIENALRAAFARRRYTRRRSPVRLPVVRGGRVRPGVDLDNTAALLDLTELPDDSP